MKSQEIIDRVNKLGLLQFLFEGEAYDEIEDENDEIIDDVDQYVKDNFGEIELLDGRADTSEFWQIVHFKDHNVYLKISGEYDSYGQGDHEYTSVKEVFPKEVKVTVYE